MVGIRAGAPVRSRSRFSTSWIFDARAWQWVEGEVPGSAQATDPSDGRQRDGKGLEREVARAL